MNELHDIPGNLHKMTMPDIGPKEICGACYLKWVRQNIAAPGRWGRFVQCPCNSAGAMRTTKGWKVITGITLEGWLDAQQWLAWTLRAPRATHSRGPARVRP